MTKLFTTIAPRYADRPGGYTRIIKLGIRPGDTAPVSVIELVEAEMKPRKVSAKPAPVKAVKVEAPVAVVEAAPVAAPVEETTEA